MFFFLNYYTATDFITEIFLSVIYTKTSLCGIYQNHDSQSACVIRFCQASSSILNQVTRGGQKETTNTLYSSDEDNR